VQDEAGALRDQLLEQQRGALLVARQQELMGGGSERREAAERTIAGLERGETVTVSGFALGAAMWNSGLYTGAQVRAVEDSGNDFAVEPTGEFEPITNVAVRPVPR
jgi:hypothetical protein